MLLCQQYVTAYNVQCFCNSKSARFYMHSEILIFNNIVSILLGAPINLTATSIDSNSIQLSWTPSKAGQVMSLFSYDVQIRNGNGTLVYTNIVREPQLIINTLDSCDQYEATVTSLCQGPVSLNVGMTIPLGK